MSTPGVTIGEPGAPGAGAAPMRYVPSVARAEGLLGLRERVGLEEAIRRTFTWHIDSHGAGAA